MIINNMLERFRSSFFSLKKELICFARVLSLKILGLGSRYITISFPGGLQELCDVVVFDVTAASRWHCRLASQDLSNFEVLYSKSLGTKPESLDN